MPRPNPAREPLPLPLPLPQVFTYDEVAEILKMTPRAVRRACDEGRLGYNAVNGRRRRITADHIREYLARTDVRPAA